MKRTRPRKRPNPAAGIRPRYGTLSPFAELGDLLGDSVRDLAAGYLRSIVAPETTEVAACDCVACKFARLAGRVSMHVEQLRTHPRDVAARTIGGLAQAAQQNAQRRAETDRSASPLAQALKVAEHTAAELNRIRQEYDAKYSPEVTTLKRNPDGSFG